MNDERKELVERVRALLNQGPPCYSHGQEYDPPFPTTEMISQGWEVIPDLLSLIDAQAAKIERLTRIADNKGAVLNAAFRKVTEICGVSVDDFSDLDPVLRGLRVDADDFYSAKNERDALRSRVAALEKAGDALLDCQTDMLIGGYKDTEHKDRASVAIINWEAARGATKE